jgi:hypothetical protein
VSPSATSAVSATRTAIQTFASVYERIRFPLGVQNSELNNATSTPTPIGTPVAVTQNAGGDYGFLIAQQQGFLMSLFGSFFSFLLPTTVAASDSTEWVIVSENRVIAQQQLFAPAMPEANDFQNKNNTRNSGWSIFDILFGFSYTKKEPQEV